MESCVSSVCTANAHACLSGTKMVRAKIFEFINGNVMWPDSYSEAFEN